MTADNMQSEFGEPKTQKMHCIFYGRVSRTGAREIVLLVYEERT